MNLRTQMLLAGALTLAVPVLGWQSVKQLDASLRQTRMDAQSLKVANARLALAESEQLQPVLRASVEPRRDTDLYAEQSDYPLFIDGYVDDWQHQLAPAKTWKRTQKDSFSVQLAIRGQRLFLFVDVSDDKVQYHRPPRIRTDLGEEESHDAEKFLVNGDAVELLVTTLAGKAEHVLFRAIAPGPVFARRADKTIVHTGGGVELTNYQGAWTASSQGYRLEIGMPLPPASSSIAIAVVDVDRPGQLRDQWMGSLSPTAMASALVSATVSVNESDNGSANTSSDTSANKPAAMPARIGRLFYPATVASSKLKPWVTLGTRARLFDRQGRLIADVNSLYERSEFDDQFDPARGGFFNAVLFRVFAYFVAATDINSSPVILRDGLHLPQDILDNLAAGDADTRLYVTEDRDQVLGTMVPIGGDETNGFLLFESNEDLATAYSGSQVARLFSLLTLVSVLAGLVLLIYASILSMRIRGLSRLARHAVADDGRVRGLPESQARDEIGDLSRNLTQLLARSANYTRYLEALSSRLSHELRTPLSVVKTSIENMDRDRLDPETVTLLDRASGGADQLGTIIRALVDSTRLEQTVQQAQMQRVDLVEWVHGAQSRYQQVYPNLHFSLTLTHASMPCVVAPELLMQAMDKLVANAVSFSTDGQVNLQLQHKASRHGDCVEISVGNRGPGIAEHDSAHLFDPMYSQRHSDDNELHLGLGLYIVRMIAEAHGGKPVVANSIDGVRIGLWLPVAGAL